MVDPLVLGGVAAGIYALVSAGKKESQPPSTQTLITAAVPVVRQQVGQGVPKDVVVRAAATIVQDMQIQAIVKADACVMFFDPARSSRTYPYILPDAVMKALRDLGWREQSSTTGMVSTGPIQPKPGTTTTQWSQIVMSFPTELSSRRYLCPSGKSIPQ